MRKLKEFIIEKLVLLCGLASMLFVLLIVLFLLHAVCQFARAHLKVFYDNPLRHESGCVW